MDNQSQSINVLNANDILQNINSNNIVVINQGVDYEQILRYIDSNTKNLEDKINQHLNLSLELVKKEFARKLEILQFTLKQESYQFNMDIGTLRTIHQIKNIYSDYPDNDLLSRLCDILVYLVVAPESDSRMTMLRITLSEAINTAKLITREHLKLLAFIFLIRNCKFKNIKCLDTFKFFLSEILWKFKPNNLSNIILPKHLEFSRCTTFVNREGTIEKMLVNTYLPVLEIKESSVSSDLLTIEFIFSSVIQNLNLNAIPETSRLSKQFADSFNLNQIEESEEIKYSKQDYCSSRKGSESKKSAQFVVDLLKNLDNGEQIQNEWVYSPIKNHVLTPVGMVLAISFIRQEFNLDLPYHKWID